MTTATQRVEVTLRRTTRCVGLLLLGLSGCGDPSAPEPPSIPRGGFEDVTALRWKHEGLPRGSAAYFMPESIGSGFVAFDANGDGRTDVYVVQGGVDDEGRVIARASCNVLMLQSEDGVFREATDSGLEDDGFGLGAAVGDVDADGDLDVYVTNFGPDRLYRNEGGRFVDVTSDAGLGDDGWSTTAGFFDADGDGDLDLFVVRYVHYDPVRMKGRDDAGRPEYPGPESLLGTTDRLYRNDGGWKFTDVTEAAGLGVRRGKGLGLVFDDLDGDGREDIYVANDREPNFAWIALGNGRYEERAEALGIAVDQFGRPEASMGVATGDVDGDGQRDLLLTHFVRETHTLYRRLGPNRWTDATSASGLAAPTIEMTGWGLALEDFDLDGDVDLAVTNGRVIRATTHPRATLGGRWAPYAEPDQFFVNDGRGRFSVEPDLGGDFTAACDVGRGLLARDLDEDGDPDLLVSQGTGTFRIFENRLTRTGHWLAVRPRDPTGLVDVLGAEVTVTVGTMVRSRHHSFTTSYLVNSDAPCHFGLGAANGSARVTVRWPDGSLEEFGPFALNRSITVERSRGRPGR